MFGTGWTRRVVHSGALAMAVIAVALRILAPQGFMPDLRPGAAAHGFALVICSGHTPGELDAPDLAKAGRGSKRSGQTNHDGLCAFAGTALAQAQLYTAFERAPQIAALADLSGAIRGVAPGRGLTAPPRQTGPPHLV